MEKEIFILSGARTPIGSYLGSLANVPTTTLGAKAISGALSRTDISNDQVERVYMGNVLMGGEGQAPARQAAIYAGLPNSIPCTTINKVCGSGMESIIMGAQAIMCNDAQVVVAGGMENMSLSPHFIPNSRSTFKFGSVEIKDSMQWDGLWDPYSNQAMGNCAEEVVKKYNMSRSEQDNWAISSFKRAQGAAKEGIFKEEITPITLKGRKGETLIEDDEGPFKAKFDKIPTLRPVFDKNGTVTAANASTINDGAAAVVLADENYKSMAQFKIVAYAGHAGEPTWFTTAPAEAMKKCLKRCPSNITFEDIDLFEINEAFAAVTLAAIKELSLPQEKVNIYGGAVSLGHPIGCSGTRIVVTLMNAMKRKQVRYGMASICIGGGEALSLILERC